MSMFFRLNIRFQSADRGSALVIALIVLAILGALGVASLDVADMNILISANDRDAKDAFFHADSGANVGHEYLEDSLFALNSTYYDSDANVWSGNFTFVPANFSLQFYVNGQIGTYIRSGLLDTEINRGSAMQIGAGYEGIGKGAAGGGTLSNYLVRSHRLGQRNSQAEVDLGWKHINY